MFNPESPRKGQLIIDLELLTDEETAEEADELGLPEDVEVVVHGARVSLSVECGDLTVNDIEAADPAKYLDNGPIAGLISALAHALSEEGPDSLMVKTGERMAEKAALAHKALTAMENLGLTPEHLKIMCAMNESGASRDEIFSKVRGSEPNLETMKAEGNA